MQISATTPKITEYIDVRKRMADLGCQYPQHMALLPINFDSAKSIGEFLQASEAATIKKLLVAQKLPLDEILDRRHRPPYVKNKSHEWVAPILFVSASLYSQNQALVSVALDVVGNYATDFFKGARTMRDVSLDIVVEKNNNTYKKVSYRGPVEGLRGLVQVVREVEDE